MTRVVSQPKLNSEPMREKNVTRNEVNQISRKRKEAFWLLKRQNKSHIGQTKHPKIVSDMLKQSMTNYVVLS